MGDLRDTCARLHAQGQQWLKRETALVGMVLWAVGITTLAWLPMTGVAQLLAVCRRSTVVSMGTRRHRKGSPLCMRWALKSRRGCQLRGQYLRATKGEKLSELNIVQNTPRKGSFVHQIGC